MRPLCWISLCLLINLIISPDGIQHTRLPCPSLSPRVCSNSCPLSQWCYHTISSSFLSFCFNSSLSSEGRSFTQENQYSNSDHKLHNWPVKFHWYFSIDALHSKIWTHILSLCRLQDFCWFFILVQNFPQIIYIGLQLVIYCFCCFCDGHNCCDLITLRLVDVTVSLILCHSDCRRKSLSLAIVLH